MKSLLASGLSRRAFLRAGAVAIALPVFERFLPRGLTAAESSDALAPRRLFLISRPLGLHAPNFFPKTAGMDYQSTPYLKLLEAHRGQFTVFSGLSHLGYPNAHHTEAAIFTGADPGGIKRDDDLRNTVSLDQLVAEKIGRSTRFAYLALGGGNKPASWSRRGIAVPNERRAHQVFARLFLTGKPAEVAGEKKRLEEGRSILDGVRDQLKSIGRDLGGEDRERLDVFTTSIRQAEEHLRQDEAWVAKPKPKVNYEAHDYSTAQWIERQRQWYDIVQLVFQTDLARVIVLQHGENSGEVPATIHQHDASHHGQSETKIEQLALYETAELQQFAGLLTSLSKSQEQGVTLLDRTQVLLASNLGNASAHSTQNLPILLAGGGFKHQGHLAFDPKNNTPLSNLYVRMLQQMGMETERFGSSTGVVGGLG